MCVCVCMRVYAGVYACMRACVFVCLCEPGEAVANDALRLPGECGFEYGASVDVGVSVVLSSGWVSVRMRVRGRRVYSGWGGGWEVGWWGYQWL